MSPSPAKPWENQSGPTAASTSPSPGPSADNPVTSLSPSAPPVPLRSYENSDFVSNTATASSMYPSRFGSAYGGAGSYNSLSSFSSPYSRLGGIGNGMYGGYGGYGGYSAMGGLGGYGGFGTMGDPNDPNGISRRMESGTQATFQIIESIVGAFGGFAQMLESTFMATHSSFFGIFYFDFSNCSNGIPEQFGNLRDTLGSIFGIYALMRYIRAFIARLRGQPAPPEEVEISGNSLPVTELDTPPNPGASKKPLLLFLLSVFGLPYLIGKLIRSVAYYHSQAVSSRHMGQSSALLCRAIFDFVPQNPRSELPLRKGEIITIIAQGSSGWWRGRLQDGREGFVPATYLVSMVNQSQPIFNAGTPGQQTEGQTLTEEFEGK